MAKNVITAGFSCFLVSHRISFQKKSTLNGGKDRQVPKHGIENHVKALQFAIDRSGIRNDDGGYQPFERNPIRIGYEIITKHKVSNITRYIIEDSRLGCVDINDLG